jgi:hypothetical protein
MNEQNEDQQENGKLVFPFHIGFFRNGSRNWDFDKRWFTQITE